ncbi:uncharacterized protein [Aristolochia californica]|uniref:uncharacterized protein n=1 Tax=Aristolochia californica TaxID=171875 RepID=UPI0035D9786E
MSLISSFGFYNNGGLHLPNRHRNNDLKGTAARHFQRSHLFKHGYNFLKNEGFRRGNLNSAVKFRVNASSGGKIPPPFANLPKPNLPEWAKGIVGLVFSLIRPFWAITGGRLLSFQRDVESVVQKVEDVVEVIDDVADTVVKVADEVAENLPEGGWMRNTVECIEEVSKEVSDGAEDAIDIINKFQEVSDDVENFMEQVVDGEYESKEEEEKHQKEELQIGEGKLQQTGISGTIKEESSTETMKIKS